MRVKICGLTVAAEARAAAQLGVHALGFICVPGSARSIEPEQIRAIVRGLPPFIERVGVFVDATLTTIEATVRVGGLNAVQLHGSESPDFCACLAERLPGVTRIKALRIRDHNDLATAWSYCDNVEAVLLDAYHPKQAGGTGIALDWPTLAGFKPPLPWILSGGLRPGNLAQALAILQPDAIDLSSGVEDGIPGRKDLAKVAQIMRLVHRMEIPDVLPSQH